MEEATHPNFDPPGLVYSDRKARDTFWRLLPKVAPVAADSFLGIYRNAQQAGCLKVNEANASTTTFKAAKINPAQPTSEFDYAIIEALNHFLTDPVFPFEELRKQRGIWKDDPDTFPIPGMGITRFLPSWKELSTHTQSSKTLSKLVADLCNKWNLTSDWCRDFAVSTIFTAVRDTTNILEPSNDEFISHVPEIGSERYFALWDKAAERHDSHLVSEFMGQRSVRHGACNELFRYKWMIPNENQATEAFDFGIHFDGLENLSSSYFIQTAERQLWKRLLTHYGDVGELAGRLAEIRQNIEQFHLAANAYFLSEIGSRGPAARKRSGKLHFRWLAEFQVARKEYQEIADETQGDKRVEKKAVINGIEKAADLLDLKLRPAKRKSGSGRPRNRKEPPGTRRRS
jgi:hypothetical protein